MLSSCPVIYHTCMLERVGGVIGVFVYTSVIHLFNLISASLSSFSPSQHTLLYLPLFPLIFSFLSVSNVGDGDAGDLDLICNHTEDSSV